MHPLEIAHETRQYVGTPDAAMRGEYGQDMNILFHVLERLSARQDPNG